MKTFKTAAVVLGLAIAALAMNGTSAYADYGAVKIRNTSNVPIHYEFKWGADSEWRQNCVYPGQYMAHWIQLDQHGRAPAPYIRFDCVAGDGQTTWKSYKLGFYSTHQTSGGKSHRFKFSPYGTYLDLYCD